MASTVEGLPVSSGSAGWGATRLWNRALERYPERRLRITCLTIVVLTTIMLYYELYVGGAVGPTIIGHYGMTFRYYVYGSGVFASLFGAFFSLIAGAGDRWGRANMVTYGLGITALGVLFLPSMPTKFWYFFLVCVIGAVEGMVLVATPALVRDFSPQVGRASAMGFWTLGPVCGSLVVAIVSSNTLSHLHAWQDQFTICGIAGLGLFAFALLFLRELSPNLRDQLMVSMRDRMLVEARAKGLDIESALRHPWRQMVRWNIVGSAFGVSVMLLFYYAMVGFLVIYFGAMFGWSTQKANTLGDWFWAFDAGGLIVAGYLSDKLRVRKPFMVGGAVVAAVMTYVFLTRTTHPTTSFSSFVIIFIILSLGLAFAYAPWMAAFTETVEKRNPALVATGLAIWGWVIRGVVTLSSLLLPIVVASMTPLVTYGATVAKYAAQYKTELATAAAVPTATLTAAGKGTGAAIGKAVADVESKFNITAGTAVKRLTALAAAAKQPGFKYLQAHGTSVTKAVKQAPSQWKEWWWVCIAGMIVFIPTIFLATGRWSPAKAKRDAEEHERLVEAELARLRVPTGGPGPSPSPTPTPAAPTA